MAKRRRLVIQSWKTKHDAYQAWRKTDDFKHWFRQRWAIQSGLCFYCDVPLETVRTNVEHVKPLSSRYGRNGKTNLVLACAACNKSKASKLFTQKERKALRERFYVERALQEQLAADLSWIAE